MPPYRKRDVASKILARQLAPEKKTIRLFDVDPSSRPFHKLPGRLCFKLSSLVDASDIRKGHVFLGFLKDGNFIISYTHRMGSDEERGKITHTYYLYWWLFVPGQKLQEVARIRLFGAKEVTIENNLSLCVCQWPQDHSKVLAYGIDVTGHTRSTYITVATNPPLSSRRQQSSDIGQNCPEPGFAVHYVNQHIPVYPVFTPIVSMKLDGICIINGGDSIIALAIETTDSADTTSGRLSLRPCHPLGSARAAAPDAVRYVEQRFAHKSACNSNDVTDPSVGGGLLGAISPLVFTMDFKGRPLLHHSGTGGVTCKLFMLNVESHFLPELCDIDGYTFVDFDMILLDVCELSLNVIGQINIVYRPKCPASLAKHGDKQTENRPFELAKRSIKFGWNLITGTVTGLGKSGFSGTYRSLKSWCCAPQEPLMLRHRFGAPSCGLHSVTSMSNTPVLQGESLKMLVDSNNYVALML